MASGFTLYHFDACPFCRRVRRAIADLGLEVELRDIRLDPQARDALLEATGQITVPVLHLHDEGRWMPESADIVRFLYARFGEGRRPPLSVRLDPRVMTLGAVLVFALFVVLVRC